MVMTMDQRFANEIVQKVEIKSPCQVNWDSMEGDAKVRFCSQCNLNVFNISEMSTTEAAAVVSQEGGRPCVYLRRRDDGTVITQNCPVALRAARDRVGLAAVLAVLCLTYGFSMAAHSQGLSVPGLTVDPRYGAIQTVGTLADYGYDCARDISRFVTWTTFLVCFFFPKKHHITVKRAIIELLVLMTIPVLVHFIGIFMINNIGGLGGGGI